MTVSDEFAVCFVLGYLSPLDGSKGLDGSVDNIEKAITIATIKLSLDEEANKRLRNLFNVRKAGD